MKYLYNIYILIFTILVFSCEDKFINDLDIDIPDQEQQLVINLELRANSTEAKTFVARTSNINESEATLYDNATVLLYKDGELLSELFFDADSRDYIAEFDSTDITTGEYRVDVSGIENLTDISATQTMPEKVDIISGEFEEDGTIEAYYGYAYAVDEAAIKFNDPSGQENYYLVNLFGVVTDTFGVELNRRNLYISSINPLAEQLFWNNGIILKDDSFDGRNLDLSLGFNNYFSYNYNNPDDVDVYLEAVLNNISRDHYLYLRSFDASRNAEDNPFAEPVIVHNNIENGIGIFRTSNASRFRIDIE